MKRNIKGAAQIVRGLRHLNLPKMQDENYIHNMTPNVSEEEAKKVREKNERTYLKSAGGIVEGAVTRSIGSGSPRMVNKLRNIK